jgi:arylsulfatase A
MISHFLPALLTAMLLQLLSEASSQAHEEVSYCGQHLAPKPTFILIVVDDLGWGELGCYGNTFNETPHIDNLAAKGLLFRKAYAASPVCSPTRAALLTGKTPPRTGITDYLRPNDEKHLLPKFQTLPKLLREMGYVTALIGKWHLSGYASHGAQEVPPSVHGFSEVICSETRGIGAGSYFPPYHFNPEIRSRLPNEHLVDRINLEAVEFITRHADKPFFLMVSHYAVHTRLAGRPDLVLKFESKPGAGRGPEAPQNNPHLAAQLAAIDEGVGMIVEALDHHNLHRHTVVFFTSDNGGEDRVTRNAHLRAGKSTLYEGGLRVPLIAFCPALIPPNSISEWPVCTYDLFPTIVELAGIPAESRGTLDGVSLVPLLRNSSVSMPPRTLCWHYPLNQPHFLGGRSAGAILRFPWKLIQYFDNGEVELFNLAEDESETQNLSARYPETATSLLQELREWRNKVTAESPFALPKVPD